ncbi:MAG: SpoIIE family protein phosphatase [Phycisphaerales bacterium]|nr:SpoIIE family protein phosphatase [Phycisphaerales bacterium]
MASVAVVPKDSNVIAPASIRSYLTDGSVARLCDELSRLTGVPIWLRDVDGSVVVPREGGTLWDLTTPERGAARAYALINRVVPERMDLFLAPLQSSRGPIGAIAMPADWDRDDPVGRRALERAVILLAGTIVETVESSIALSHRVGDLDALYRLSSALARAHDADSVLEIALDLALDALKCDAGSIAMLDEKSGELTHRVTRNLSAEWLAESSPLSIDGMLRSSALRGDVVCVEDLMHDERIVDPSRPRAEQLCSLITTGLVYQGRSAGLVRLYGREPREFTKGECDLLRSIADHAAMVVALQRLRQLREQDQQTQRQLRLAADVQRRMMPRTMPSYDRLDLAAKYAPSFQLGGDFYDIFEKGGTNRELGIAVGDVVGKGVPAAILMSAARASLRAFAGEEWRLQEVIRKLNQAIVRDTLESEFLTLWCGVIEPRSMELAYCAAGHDPAMLFSRDNAAAAGADSGGFTVKLLDEGGMAVGIDAGQTYDVGKVMLRAGDTLLLYTDGLSEALNFEGEAFGRHRIRKCVIDLLSTNASATAQEIIDRLVWSLRQFAGVRLSGDDITIVALRVK